MSHHVTLSLHWLEAATVNSFLDSVTSLLSLRAETVVRGREGGRDTMRERDTEKNRVRERMRKRGRDGMR